MENNKTPVYCPHCGGLVCYQEDIAFMVIPDEGIRCPHCEKIAVEKTHPLWQQ